MSEPTKAPPVSQPAEKPSVVTQRMKGMGSPTGEFDAMPPPQHQALRDRREQNHIRVLSELWQGGTIHWCDDGTHAPWYRTRDGRRPGGVKDIAVELDMSEPRVCEALEVLVQRGWIRIEKKPYRVFVLADCPSPEIAKVEGEGKKKEGSEYLELLDLNQSEEAHLARIHNEQGEAAFHAFMARLIAVRTWGKKNQADLMAHGRAIESDQWQREFTETAYTNKEKRGNKTKPEKQQPPKLLTFDEFRVHETDACGKAEQIARHFRVLDSKVKPYTIPQNGVQKQHPYGLEQPDFQTSSLASNEGVNAASASGEAKAGAARSETRKRERMAEARKKLLEMLREEKATRLGAVDVNVQTQNNIADALTWDGLTDHDAGEIIGGELRRAVKEILSGKKKAEKAGGEWGILVRVARDEAESRGGKKPFKVEIQQQMKVAVRGMEMGKAKGKGA
jgi:hypothetical protein